MFDISIVWQIFIFLHPFFITIFRISSYLLLLTSIFKCLSTIFSETFVTSFKCLSSMFVIIVYGNFCLIIRLFVINNFGNFCLVFEIVCGQYFLKPNFCLSSYRKFLTCLTSFLSSIFWQAAVRLAPMVNSIPVLEIQ